VKATNVTLSLRQRAFELDRSNIPEQVSTARTLAHTMMGSHFARHAHREALDFINSIGTTQFAEYEGSLHTTTSTPQSQVEPIPKPYGLKGGAAREALIETLGLRAPETPRDLDLIRRGSHFTPHDEAIARTLMPRDYRYGARVELITDLNRYLTSRDITINEVAILDGSLHASPLALLDTIGQVLRPSRYRGGTLHREPGISGRTLLKMIRLQAEGTLRGESWSVIGIPLETSFSDIDLAIHLNKAFQHSKAAAGLFASYCSTLGLIAPDREPLEYLLTELAHLGHGEESLLRDVPREEIPKL